MRIALVPTLLFAALALLFVVSAVNVEAGLSVLKNPPKPTAPAHAAATTATLNVDYTTRPANESIDMWGLFFEELSGLGVHGLYNQLLNNSNFEIAGVPYAAAYSLTEVDGKPLDTYYEPWFLLPSTTGQEAWIGVSEDFPLNGWNTHSIYVRSEGGQGSLQWVTLVNPGFNVNPGYYGINTIGVTKYTVSFYAMAQPKFYAAPSTLTVSIYSNTTGNAYSSSSIAVSLTSTWQKFTITMTMPSSGVNDSSAYFSIAWPVTQTTATVVYFDVITLYPNDGWNGLPYIRPDMAQIIADMHPSFLRFPGGCYVEGMVLDNRYNWKSSIGPIEQRHGHWGIWGYYSEDYLGIYEYFSFVEKLTDAYGDPTRAYWVINTGNSHFQQLAPDRLGQYVQDALDSIEFIMGPSTSYYGSIRAAMGHPEPFTSLTHVSVGNEGNLIANWQNAYVPNYAVIYKALKAAYPQLTYIANANLQAFNVPTEMWDYHVYQPDTWFFNNTHLFDPDVAPRTLPSVFNSEYAAVSGPGTAICALSEAAWLAGLERNADLVTAVSYGALPMCVSWDNHRVYGTPSYWTQWLFSNANQGTVSGTVQTLAYQLSTSPPQPAGAVPTLFAVSTIGMLNTTMAAQKNATHVVLIKVINADTTAVSVTIDVANVPSTGAIQSVADVWTLAATSPNEGNSFQEPTAVAPVQSTTKVPTDGSPLVYSFAPLSTTLVRVYVNA